ncbi:hypothetical protein ACJMK2_009210 [Sinanodonta woodiana]|uniref:3'-5' exonuclease domain-containing protein n=1 Tax=Sinanodonta woodiana TaxID=1069815 RepID=A0ABD3VBJ4_SINWO
MASSPNPHLYSPSTKAGAVKAVQELQKETVLAVDSEGVHLGKTGLLTLLQVGTMSGKVYLFDVLKNEKEQDKRFFKDTGLDAILTSSDIVKVIHSCARDSAALIHQFGIYLKNVFDTQVAHLIIEEQKGRKLPSRLKLMEICRTYSTEACVYERKEEFKNEWAIRQGDFWATRPITPEMIAYASGDVTAVIPEVYETQKGFLEKHCLLGIFEARVKEELYYHFNKAARIRRKLRNDGNVQAILKDMSKKYCLGTDFQSLTEKDEISALSLLRLEEAYRYPPVIQHLKEASWRAKAKKLEESLKATEQTYFTGLDYELQNVESGGTVDMKREIRRLKKLSVPIINQIFCEKYNANTPWQKISSNDIEILRSFRPIEETYDPVVLSVYQKVKHIYI